MNTSSHASDGDALDDTELLGDALALGLAEADGELLALALGD